VNFVSEVRPSPGAQCTLVLMHGLGSDEQDMLGFAEELDSRIEVICLRAPIAYGPGYAWFDIQWTLKGIQIDEQQYWNSVSHVADYLRSLERENLLIGGFSQGAMMSLGVLNQPPEIANGAVLLSGRGIIDACPDFNGSVFHAHGTLDEVIPIQEARSLRQSLQSLGDRYEYHEYQMGHGINQEEVNDLNQWLARFLVL